MGKKSVKFGKESPKKLHFSIFRGNFLGGCFLPHLPKSYHFPLGVGSGRNIDQGSPRAFGDRGGDFSEIVPPWWGGHPGGGTRSDRGWDAYFHKIMTILSAHT